MFNKKKYNLVSIIYDDLCIYGRLQLFLLLLVLISAMLVVIVTYQTRCVVAYREGLLLEKSVLDAEWNGLILDEKILSSFSRIENISIDDLHMHYIEITQDNILADL